MVFRQQGKENLTKCNFQETEQRRSRGTKAQLDVRSCGVHSPGMDFKSLQGLNP